MNWIKGNRFLAAFFAIMLVGVLGLGYLLYSAYSAYSDVSDSYDKQATELVRLQNLTPYPDDVSLKKYTEQRDLYAHNLTDLRTTLAGWNRRLQPKTPQEFQEELKESAADFNTRATAAGMRLQDNFYMGFDDYRDSAPNPDAASPLDRQLKGAEVILNALLESRVASILVFTRKQLPEETGDQPPPGKAAAPLMTYYPFDLKFNAGQPEVHRFLNAIVRNKEQFFVIRSILIANSRGKGPPRAIEAPEAEGVVRPDGPASQSAAGAIQFILGKEVLGVTMRIEIVEFADPAPGT